MHIRNLPIKSIRILGRHRPLVAKRVRQLVDSIEKIGLKTPPSVRIKKLGPVLVAGRHRIEALKLLGFDSVDCVVFEGDKVDARLWTVAENLHRAGLTKI